MLNRRKSSGRNALVAACTVAVLACGVDALAQSTKVNAVIGEQAKAEEAARASQKRVEQLDEETTKMLADYRQMLAETQSLTSYNQQLGVQVASQQGQIDEMTQQLGQIETTSREVLPMMDKMLATLEQFVKNLNVFHPENLR